MHVYILTQSTVTKTKTNPSVLVNLNPLYIKEFIDENDAILTIQYGNLCYKPTKTIISNFIFILSLLKYWAL